MELSEKVHINEENNKMQRKQEEKSTSECVESKGGLPLDEIGTISLEQKSSQTLESLLAEKQRYLDERDKIGKPKKDAKKKRQRHILMQKAKKIEKQIEYMQKKTKIKETHTEDDIEKYKNLAMVINYRVKGNLSQMNEYSFQIEKYNILAKADKFFTKPAKTISGMLIRMSKVSDGFPKIRGYSKDLEESKYIIEEQVKKVLIDQGMQGISVGNYLSNPYIGLGIALSIPLVARYYANKSLPRPKETLAKNA